MKILYASAGYKPAFRQGGPILSVSAAAEKLTQSGHRVVVFTTDSNLDQDLGVAVDRPIEVDGVEVWYFRRADAVQRSLPIPYFSRSIGYLYCPKMKEALDQIMPTVDVVHTQGPFIYPTYAASSSARRFRKPLFYSQRGAFDPKRLRFRSLKKKLYIAMVERGIMQGATTLIALTDYEVESYRRLGVRTPIVVIPNGVDVDELRLGSAAAAEARWRLSPEALAVLFLGRLHPIKGADLLIEAFLRVQHQVPRGVLIMAGPDEWGLEARFRQRVTEAGLLGRVVFPGMVSGEAKRDLLARADLFCLPSEAEGFSMATLEALATETPVLISPGCHFPQVEAAEAGRVVDKDVEQVARALRDLLSDPQRLSEMGRRGRELVTRDYSWETVAARLIETYCEGVERHRSPKE